MAEQNGQQKPHFILDHLADSQPFRTPSPGGGGGPAVPARDRQAHGNALLRQLQALRPQFKQAHSEQEQAGLESGFSLRVEFESFPDIELAFESLARERSGIELLNVHHEGNRTVATVLVPEGKLDTFEKLIAAYLDESKDGKNGPKHHPLLNAIAEIRAATLKSLWTDDPAEFPVSDDEVLWWEVWLPVLGDRAATNARFRQLVQGLELRLAEGELQFPERTVLLAQGSARTMRRSMMTLNSIAELRRAKETAEFFDGLPPSEQPTWLEELLTRTTFPAAGANAPCVCVVDTGVNHGHPLLAPVLDARDLHTVEPGWGVDDGEGHGTEMAGLALVGNLSEALASNQPLVIDHRLESVKLLSHDGGNEGDAMLHGYLTIEAIARPEIAAPERSRVFSMAITARDNRDHGRPSAWSSTIDRLASDADSQGLTRRLIILSAGNVTDSNAWFEYPESNSSDGIHDPAQAWNAITVGAATELINITEADAGGYQPVAPLGGLSPFSTTSLTWESHWPLKPDVVFEGGNASKDDIGAVWMPSLSLLTTNAQMNERLFTTTNATSAASALAARMAAQLMATYPDLWPESIRALMVHSAGWTDAMKQTFLPAMGNVTKAHWVNLIRHCGFGIPNLERAMWSVDNSLTLICEDQLFPFKKEGSNIKTRDMNLHRLPWPLDELEALGATEVEMRVTLSYFIEPNPSARGPKSRYRYESHGLRFDVRRPLESDQEFQARINAAARDEEEHTRTAGSDSRWIIGTDNRHKGSLHSDIWRGTAADLARRGVIAVYPTLGWWKTRQGLERYNLPARYALIVSIHAPKTEIDLYSAVETKITVPVAVTV